MSILIFIVILAVLILVHEFGHFIVAKAFRIRVDEFGLGFPPKLWGKKFGETEYTVNALPIGGFVRIFGQDPSEEKLLDLHKKRNFSHKPKIIQAAVLLAGVCFNLLLAWGLLTVGLVSGIPASQDEAKLRGATLERPMLTITSVAADSPAEKAGILTGDSVLGIGVPKNAMLLPTPEQFQKFIADHPNQEVKVFLKRGYEVPKVLVTPQTGIFSGRAAIGVSIDTYGTLRLPFFSAIKEGGALTLLYTQMTFAGLYDLIHDAILGRADLSGVSGPVGIVKIVGDASALGFSHVLILTALISINLAVVNVLPIPALDGGRFFFLLIEAVRRKPLPSRVVNMSNMIGFAVLIGLIALITFHDIWVIFIP